MQLPKSAQEIADVIGRERALYLIGKLPRCTPPSTRSSKGGEQRVMLYVPTLARLKPDHQLVRIIGWDDAVKMCRHFGGEILQPGNCAEIYRKFRDASIIRLVGDGVPVKTVAEWMNVTDRHVRGLLVKEKAQEEMKAAANDNAPTIHTKARA